MGDVLLRESARFWQRHHDLVRQALERGDRIHAYDLTLAKEAVSDYLESGGKLVSNNVKGMDRWMDPDDWNHWMKIQPR